VVSAEHFVHGIDEFLHGGFGFVAHVGDVEGSRRKRAEAFRHLSWRNAFLLIALSMCSDFFSMMLE